MLLSIWIATIYRGHRDTELRCRRKAGWGWALGSKLAVSFKAEGHADRAAFLAKVPEASSAEGWLEPIPPLTDSTRKGLRRTRWLNKCVPTEEGNPRFRMNFLLWALPPFPSKTQIDILRGSNRVLWKKPTRGRHTQTSIEGCSSWLSLVPRLGKYDYVPVTLKWNTF